MTAVFHRGGWPGVQLLPHGWGCELCVGKGTLLSEKQPLLRQ